jgi:hypothetical protein
MVCYPTPVIFYRDFTNALMRGERLAVATYGQERR